APAHEAMQSAQFGDKLLAWAQRQVVGVAQDHLRAGCLEHVDGHALDGPLRANRHEGRHLHWAMRRRKRASPGGTMGVAVLDGKRELGHGYGAAGCGGLESGVTASMSARSYFGATLRRSSSTRPLSIRPATAWVPLRSCVASSAAELLAGDR